MKQTKLENITISYEAFNMTKHYSIKLLDHMVKSFISAGVFFIFLSIFTYNLQLQTMDVSTGKITKAYDIVQVNTLANNLKSYFLEH